MTYISLNYYLFVLVALVIYYIFPVRARWFVLLVANGAFYYLFYKDGWWIFLITMVFTYGMGLAIEKSGETIKKILLASGVLVDIIPWLIIKNGNFLLTTFTTRRPISFIVPMGISFYTLQLISYLVDVKRGAVNAEKNPLEFILFASFFPQIIQGPIPRFGQLAPQLISGQRFDDRKIMRGFCYIIWGFFLKLVIAERAAIIVNTVFGDIETYAGAYLWLAMVLYAIELYTDFLSCTTLAQGVAFLFGIELMDNFRRPFFSTSIKELWNRWHISLSTWLRDYIYFPLGGNRKGKLLKFLFLIITFAFSGLWHGAGLKFIIWGLINALCMIIGELTNPLRERAYKILKINPDSRNKRHIKQLCTFLLFSIIFVTFRAETMSLAIDYYRAMLTTFNPWVLVTKDIFTLGLGYKDFIVLILAIMILFMASYVNEKGDNVTERVLSHVFIVRLIIYVVAILSILVFGIYGTGFNASEFIYGGF